MDNRPGSRRKNVIGGSGSVHKRGSGLGTGPVGTTGGRRSSGGYGSSGGSHGSGSSGGGFPSGGMGGKLIGIVVVVVVLFLGMKLMSGNGGISSILNTVAGGGNVANVLTDLTNGAGNVADEFQIGSQGTGNWQLSSADLNTREIGRAHV